MLTNFKINPETNCWEWQGSRNQDGYGWVYWDGRTHLAHRIAWVLYYGAIDSGQCICHHCDNPGCINPSHLFKGTRADNNRDRSNKGRSVGGQVFGTRNGRGKLTDEQVQEIRARFTKPSDAPILAVEYGVARTTIVNIVRGRRRQFSEAA